MDKILVTVTGAISLALLVFSETFMSFLEVDAFRRLIEADTLTLKLFCKSLEKGKCFYDEPNYIYIFYLSLAIGLIFSVAVSILSKKNRYDGVKFKKVFPELAMYLVATPFAVDLALNIPVANKFPPSYHNTLQEGLGQYWFLPNILCSSLFAMGCFYLLQIFKSQLERRHST